MVRRLGGDARRSVVLDGERGCRRGRVVAIVGGREGHRHAARLPAGVADGRRIRAVAPCHSAADIRGRSPAVVVEPVGQLRGVAGTVTVDGFIRSRRGEARCRGVLDGEGGRHRGRVAAGVRGREGHGHGAGGAALIAELGRVRALAPGHGTAIVRGSGPAVTTDPAVECADIACPVTLDGLVRSTAQIR